MSTNAPVIFDYVTETTRPATQADVDELCRIVRLLNACPIPVKPADYDHPEQFQFRLAIYPNPMRDDSVFVAEEKTIQPYEGITDRRGNKVSQLDEPPENAVRR